MGGMESGEVINDRQKFGGKASWNRDLKDESILMWEIMGTLLIKWTKAKRVKVVFSDLIVEH